MVMPWQPKLELQNQMEASSSKSFFSPTIKVISVAFASSLFIYAILLLVFKVSASDLVSSTTFWFFISSTIIILIGADYGAFASHKLTDYEMRRQSSAPCSVRTRFSVNREQSAESETNSLTDQMKLTLKNIRDPERSLAIPPELPRDTKVRSWLNEEFMNATGEQRGREIRRKDSSNKSRRRMKRSWSEIKFDPGKRVVFDESRNTIRMIEKEDGEDEFSVDYYNGCQHEDEDDHEASYHLLTNDELNRRVEDFIKKFNNQIWVSGDSGDAAF